MGDWQPIETAPGGVAIQARIPDHGDDNVITWETLAVEGPDGPVGAWVYASDQEPPPCWSDGYCWAFNEDGARSAWPTHWKPLAQAGAIESADQPLMSEDGHG